MTDEKTATSELQSDDDLVASVSTLMEENPQPVAEDSAKTELTENEEQETTVEEVQEEKSELDPHVQKSIDKRIAKEVSKRKAKEDQISELQKKVELLEGKITTETIQPKAPTDLDAMTQTQLQDVEKEAKEYILWANEGPLHDGYEATDEKTGESKFYSPEEIRETYNYFNKRVLLDIPEAQQKRVVLAEKLNAVAIANPVLQDEATEEYKMFKKVWTSKEYESLKNHDNGAEMCWLMVQGLLGDSSKKQIKPISPPNFVPPPAPNLPVSPAPSRAKSISKQSKAGKTSLSEQDYQAVAQGDLVDAVSKLMQ